MGSSALYKFININTTDTAEICATVTYRGDRSSEHVHLIGYRSEVFPVSESDGKYTVLQQFREC